MFQGVGNDVYTIAVGGLTASRVQFFDRPGRREASGGHGDLTLWEDVHNGVTISALTSADRGDAMRIFGYLGINFLIVCMLLVGAKALSVDTTSMVIAVADMTQVVAPDATQSQNETDSALEQLQDSAEEQGDLLNIRD
jgi:hypothetical protein